MYLPGMNTYQQQLVLQMLAYAAQRDVPVTQLCKLSGIDPQALQGSKPVNFTAKKWEELWGNAMQLSGDDLFGLHFGESMQVAALGIVGQIIQTSRTVGEAITHAASMTHLLTSLFRIDIEQAGRHFTLQFIPLVTEHEQATLTFRQTMDFFLVFVVHELDGLVFEKIIPKAVRLPRLQGPVEEYERVLRCRPVKRAGAYELVFEQRYWNLPILTANFSLQKVLLTQVQEMMQEVVDPQTWQGRIYQYMLSNAYLGVVSLETIAANFNLTPRSLQRRLKEEGLTYQELADSVKKAMALHYLQTSDSPVKEIAAILGYNELSAFARAFKKWTGNTPGSYRKTKE